MSQQSPETVPVNDMLRSAHEIALRKGKDTNWSAFTNRLRRCLLEQSGLSADTVDAQLILRATCTARSFRLPPGESQP